MSNISVYEVFNDQWHCQNWLLQDNVLPSLHDHCFDIRDYGSDSWVADAHHDRSPGSGFLEAHMTNWDEPQQVPPMQTNIPGGAYPWSASNNFMAPSFMQNSEIDPEPSPRPPHLVPRKRRRSASSSISNSVASSTSGGNDRPRAATATRRETRQHGKPRKAKASSRRASAPNTGSATTASAYSSRLPHHEQGNNSSSNRSRSNSALGIHQPSRPVFQHPGRSQLNDAPCSNTVSPENSPTGNATELAVIESSIRKPHAKAEERYRDCMRAMFRRLRAVLPSSGRSIRGTDESTAVQILPPESPSLINTQERVDSEQPPSPAPPSKLTKAGVIARAIEYIQQMERETACMQDCYNRVVKENQNLSRKVQSYGGAEGAAAAAARNGAGYSCSRRLSKGRVDRLLSATK
ncbi:hypothetical protein B0J12DRAFT_723582 [Macrophomina phaseolina]|uniref:BHLH domain-containing protein n=1 Tax=Macrophomina phaseolina TaxID=35725 RepID=A0ABQ8GX70_9PEZI|nr:hypothetical protein B0J12DRAFT_723582 [Macrophomina phaseolina]